MFAVLKTGGKQYKVQAGDVLRVEKLAKDKLLMRTATPAITQYVRYQAEALPAAPAVSGSVTR